MTTKTTVPSYAWVMLALVFFSSMAAPLNLFKVPPVMEPLMLHFGISLATAGWLMAIFSVIGAILALPSGFIMARIGVKNAALTALVFLIAGGILGMKAPNIAVLLFSRILEGVGMCLMSIVAPTTLAAWFPPEKRGLAMGIWGTWVPLGSILIFTVAPWCAAKFTWTGVWWFCAGYTALNLVCVLLFFRMPQATTPPATAPTSFAEEWSNMRSMLVQPDPWRLAGSFGAYMMLTIPLTTFMPIFFQQERQFSPEFAALLATGMLIVNMLAIPIGGIASDAMRSRKKCIVYPYLLLAACMLFFYLPGNGVIYVMLAVGFIGGLAVTATFSAATEIISKPEDAGTSLAVLAFGQNLGMFAGPALYGVLAENMGWAMAGYATIPILLMGAYAALRINIR